MAQDPILTFTPEGIYCPAGDFHIDPWRPVKNALITHGHADHARAGHGRYLATHAALPVLRHRLGGVSAEGVEYGETRRIGETDVSFHPAGHVPGSAQIRVAVKGEVWVVSGDYKTEADGLSETFEPVRCHHFVTESTFGLPVFHWQPQTEVAASLNQWWAESAANGITPMLGAYSLGKAQRLLSLLEPDQGPILTHGAVEYTTRVLRAQGLPLPETLLVTPETNPKDFPGAIVLAPPAALGSAWARKFGKVSSGFASGWMQMRGVRRRRALDRGFVMSDHADWDGLNAAITATGAENVYVTHGYTDIFARWLRERGLNANVVQTEFEGEQPEDQGEVQS